MPEYCGTLPEVIAKSHRAPSAKSGVWEDTRMLKSARGDCASRAGLVGTNDARIRVELCLNSLLVTAGPQRKKWGLGGYADAKVCFRGLCLRRRACGCKPCVNTVWNDDFTRVTDIATVLKSLLDSSIPRQFLDMLDMLDSF